jgi:hypothetical protein
VSGSKRSPIPIHDRAGPRSLGAETAAFGYLRERLFLEQRVREGLWLSATCAVVGNGERRSLTLKSRRGLSFRLHIWRHPRRRWRVPITEQANTPHRCR